MTDGPPRRRLPDAVVGFAADLRALVALLDPAGGWYGVFAQRDPGGVRACLDGTEVPPWDVVEALLADLTTGYGAETAAHYDARLRHGHARAVAEHDRELCGREGLEQRLATMVNARGQARRRVGELTAALTGAHTAGDAAGADRLSTDLAWARDDLRRAAARCHELRDRLAALPDDTAPTEPPPASRAPGPSATPSARVPAQRRTPRGARFAGLDPAASEGGTARNGVVVPDPDGHPAAGDPPAGVLSPTDPFGNPVPAAHDLRAAPPADGTGTGRPGTPVRSTAPAPGSVPPARAPRGARFAGAEQAADPAARAAAAHPWHGASAQVRQEVAGTVDRLSRLRSAGRSGEAHVLLCESAAGPAERLPLLAAALERAGLGADVAVLLWEAACLPPRRLAAAADALVAAGRAEDCGQLLRQSVSRPVPEVAEAALALCASAREPQATDLLAALVRARPAEAAAAAAVDRAVLPPLLRAAAHSVSLQHGRDIEGLLARET